MVTDLDFAVYCFMTGLRLVDAEQIGPGQHELHFEDPDRKIRSFEVEYANSVFAKYAGAQRSIKRLMRSFVDQRREGRAGPVLQETYRRSNARSRQGGGQ